MKPLLLKMKAFGPYPDEAVIDFENGLKDKRMFLIHGATGSGKTSILDGLCFALYGSASIENRKTDSLRSDFVDSDTETIVELVFSISGAKYKVVRKPQRSVKKVRGDGERLVPAEAELYRWQDDYFSIIAEGVNEVGIQIKEIIGFDINQFRQVIILPQGEFRKLLEANSTERQAILTNLFHTAIYERFEIFLKEKSASYKNKYEDINGKIKDLYARTNSKTPEEVIDKIKSNENSIKKLSDEINELDVKSDAKNKELKQIEFNNNLFDELNNAETEYNKIIERKNEILDSEKRFKLGKELLTLLPYEEHLIALKDNLKQRTEELKLNRENYDKANKSYEILKTKLEELTGKKDEIDRLKLKLERLDEVSMCNIELAKLYPEEKQLQKIIKETIALKKSREQTDAEITLAIENVRAGIDESAKESWIISSDENERELKNLQQARQYISELECYTQNEKKIERELAALNTSEQKVKSLISDMEEEFKKKTASLFAHQAGILAASLKQGECCPVCGSKDHPSPAAMQDHGDTESEIKSLENKIKAEKEKSEKYKNEIIEKTGQYEAEKTRVTNITNLLGEYKSLSLINEKEKTLKQEAAVLKNNIEKYRKDSSKLSTLEIDQKRYKTEISDMSEQLNISKSQLKIIETKIESFKSRIPSEYAELSDPAGEKTKISQQIERFNKDTDIIQKEERKQGSVISKLSTKIEMLTGIIEADTIEYTKKREDFVLKIKKTGIENETEYINKKIDKNILDSMEIELREYNENLKSSQDRLNRAKIETAGKHFLSTENCKKELSDMAVEISRKTELRGTYLSDLNYLKTDYEELLKLIEMSSGLEKEYRISGLFSDVASGKTESKIPFRIYMMVTILDEVLEMSNRRLKIMSRNRYLFTRSSEKGGKGFSGLNISVFDCETGRERSASTLSGGEGFLASLSLAMGLADVVQVYSGGREMDTIFIDEGFGSLDPESLDKAIRTLIDINSSGRLVGIISHVEELKKRFNDCRLEVQKTDRGSKAEFHVL